MMLDEKFESIHNLLPHIKETHSEDEISNSYSRSEVCSTYILSSTKENDNIEK